ncbi:MAG: TolC family protein [Acidobacteria bacterium]|nr:TolC family protein [Acidobacteriota bacterium]
MNTIIRLSSILFFLTFAGVGVVLPSEDSGKSLPDTAQPAEERILTIQEAVQMALSRSPEILLAEAQTIRAREAVRESRSLNRPQVFAGSGLAYNNGMPLSIEGAAPSIFQIQMSQSILSKKNNNLIRESEEAGKASRFNKESAENDLASRTASAYFRLHQARRMITLARDRIEAAQTQQEITESLIRAGRMSKVEATSAKTAVSSARQQLLVFQEQAILAEMELKGYTGLSDEVSIHTIEPQIKIPVLEADIDILYQQALENAPDIQQAEADIRSKEFHLEAEKGERLPKLNIVGQYALLSDSNNYTDYFNRFERNNYLLGLSIQVPVFDGFRSSSRIAQSRQELSEARSRLKILKLELKLATQNGISALRIARGACEHAQNEVDAVREKVQANDAKLESGKISRKDFEEIKAQLFQKEFARLEAEQNLFQRELELLGIIGNIPAAFQ